MKWVGLGRVEEEGGGSWRYVAMVKMGIVGEVCGFKGLGMQPHLSDIKTGEVVECEEARGYLKGNNILKLRGIIISQHSLTPNTGGC